MLNVIKKETIRVVLADDHPVGSGIRNLLANAPDILVVAEAAGGTEALRMVEELAPDVLLLDMEMPGLTVVKAARQLRAAKSPVKVLAFSTHNDEQYILGLLKEEMPEAIIKAIQGVARGETGWFSQQVAAKIRRWQARNHVEEAAPEEIASLPERERQILDLMAQGRNNAQIAAELCLAEQTVRNYASRIYAGLGVSSRAEAIVWVKDRG